MIEGCFALLLFIAVAVIASLIFGPTVGILVAVGVLALIVSAVWQAVINVRRRLAAGELDDALSKRPPPAPLPVDRPAPPELTKDELRRRFRRELREGVIDQDEFDALRDIYDF